MLKGQFIFDKQSILNDNMHNKVNHYVTNLFLYIFLYSVGYQKKKNYETTLPVRGREKTFYRMFTVFCFVFSAVVFPRSIKTNKIYTPKGLPIMCIDR